MHQTQINNNVNLDTDSRQKQNPQQKLNFVIILEGCDEPTPVFLFFF